jgi:hypothetical protein
MFNKTNLKACQESSDSKSKAAKPKKEKSALKSATPNKPKAPKPKTAAAKKPAAAAKKPRHRKQQSIRHSSLIFASETLSKRPFSGPPNEFIMKNNFEKNLNLFYYQF